MDSIVAKLLEPKFFDAFIQDNMKLSTYKAEWKDEMEVEYSAHKVYQANLAEYTSAMVGSVIDKNGKKPIHQMPTIEQITGALSHMADKWQMDNDRLEQFYLLEGRYRNKRASYTPEQDNNEFRKLLDFLYRPYDRAVIAPQKRIDMLYFEGLFNGTQTVSRTNNTSANVSFTYSLNVKAFEAKVATWGNANATPLDDIQALDDYAQSKGRVIRRLRMSKRTFRKMCKSSQIISQFKMKLSRADVNAGGILSVNDVNAYLESIMLPTIVVEKDRFATLADGTSVNFTKDDRVVAQCADRVAVLKVSDPLESIDPLPNKTYSTVDNNLIGTWRTDEGRFIDYDMWATPVFTGMDNFYILKTDSVE